jgi:hypothetical protein
MERMMKLQDVILKAMAKKISWIDAAEIAGMSVCNMHSRHAPDSLSACQGLGIPPYAPARHPLLLNARYTGVFRAQPQRRAHQP